MADKIEKSEYVFIRNTTATTFGTPAPGYSVLPGLNLLRSTAWQAMLDAKQLINGLAHGEATNLRAKLADNTLRVEAVDSEFAASLGKIDRAAAARLVGEVFRPSMLSRWWQAEKRAAVREAIGRRLCDLRGYKYSADQAATLAADTERDEYVIAAGCYRLAKLYEAAGLRQWQPVAPAPRDAFAPVL